MLIPQPDPQSELAEVARELHDGLGQLITAARLMADGTPECPPIVSSLLADAMIELQRICNRISDPDSVRGSLHAGLTLLAERTSQLPGVSCSARLAPVAVDNDTARALYRIAQESVRNALSHGKATDIRINLSVTDAGLALEISDNGRWKDPDPSLPHTGLGNMYTRAERVGGAITMSRGTGHGKRTRVRCFVPACTVVTENTSDATGQ